MAQHAKNILQPSSFNRTINCPGWGWMSKGLKKTSSKYADEGTVAHDLGAICLQSETDRNPSYFKGRFGCVNQGKVLWYNDHPKELDALEVNDDMIEAVQIYIDYIRSQRRKAKYGICMIEKQFSMEWLVPGMLGTGDCTFIAPFDVLKLSDYKHGAGVPVEVRDNTQEKLYGLGALGEDNQYGVETIELNIIQPRAPHPDGPIRSWSTSVDQLYEWGNDVVRPAALRAKAMLDGKLSPELCAGDECRWCPASGDNDKKVVVCKEPARLASSKMFGDVALPSEKVITLPEVAGLSGEQIDKIVAFSPLFDRWLKAVKAEALYRLENKAPNAPPGQKLVQGRASRKWADETEVEAMARNYLGDDIYKTELKSVAQMEKALKEAGVPKDALANLVKISHGTSMVPVGDKRPAIDRGEEMFE